MPTRPYRMIQVGTGGFGGAWCRNFLPPNVTSGHVEVVAAADKNPDALDNAREHLGLQDHQLHTDIREALAAHEADFAAIVVPPAHHEMVVDLALERGLNILSEKPIADTLEAAIRIADKVKQAGVKMGVTMSHRFRQDITTLRHAIQSDESGELDYLVMRFTCNCRKRGSWGEFRHQIPDTLMIEGAVHHLDLLMDMTGAPCEQLYAETWTPRWGEFDGDAQGMVILHSENGKRATYEGAKTNAAGLNGWGHEYIRAECEQATLELNRHHLRRFPYEPHGLKWGMTSEGEHSHPLPLLEQPKWANAWLIEQFVDWLDGGKPMLTNVEANLQSIALIFAAIESSRTGKPVKVQHMLADARQR